MRARNLKPGFFKNEELAGLPALTRILFAGLWCMADRAGRLEDRPARIKAEVLPYDQCDVDAMINDLQNVKEPFVKRYEANGKRYLQVVSAPLHFNPHPNEKPSEIPRSSEKLHPKVEALGKSNRALALNPSSLNPESPIPVTPGGVKPYPIPDPITEPRKCLVLSYKSRKGIPYDNRDWDKANFGRCMAASGTLLALCGDLSSAESCLNDLAVEYENKRLSWTLETVARNAPEWLQQNGRTDANASRAGLRLAIAKRKSEGGGQTGLVKIPERAASHALRDRPDSENGVEENGGGPPGGFDDANLD